MASASSIPVPAALPISQSVEAIVKGFAVSQAAEPHTSLVVMAIRALTEVIEQSEATTVMGVEKDLRAAIDRLTSESGTHFISLGAACELFLRFMDISVMETPDFDECKKMLIERGTAYADKCLNSRSVIAGLGKPFLRDGMVIMTRGYSRVVYEMLRGADAQVSVICLETRPDASGYLMAERLKSIDIPVKIMLDSAAAYAMETVDAVLLGAEGVVENGGIISGIGTYQIALLAHALNKPFHVGVESFKFARMFPLGERDLPERCLEEKPFDPVGSVVNGTHQPGAFPKGVEIVNPLWDYTPPKLITLLFTDLGVLTPSAVSDELIKLHGQW